MRYVLLTIFLWLSNSAQAQDCPRIISQSPYITYTLQWLGLEDCIVGVSRYDTLELPTTGGILDPDKQAIDSLMAEIIFTTNWITEEKMAKSTPEGVQFYRLNGFDSMSEIIQNLKLILDITNQTQKQHKIHQFSNELRTRIKNINANNRSALLLSSCSGSPYSFGKRTWLYDLFQQIGFTLVETHEKIRHLKPGNEIEGITSLLNTFKPDILFIFERKKSSRCKLVIPDVPVKFILLDGENFLHPAPVILKGLKELDKKQASWY
ncbi:MAG: ABC transporter substrate-binding protein [Gammaproteobacteria bacterium]|nr:ABC transporter substrate-binding protein [Gammaproteobacteria bacterium]